MAAGIAAFMLLVPNAHPFFAKAPQSYASPKFGFSFNVPPGASTDSKSPWDVDLSQGEGRVEINVEDDIFGTVAKSGSVHEDFFNVYARNRVTSIFGADGPMGSTRCSKIKSEKLYRSKTGLNVAEFLIFCQHEPKGRYPDYTMGPVFVVDISRPTWPMALLLYASRQEMASEGEIALAREVIDSLTIDSKAFLADVHTFNYGRHGFSIDIPNHCDFNGTNHLHMILDGPYARHEIFVLEEEFATFLKENHNPSDPFRTFAKDYAAKACGAGISLKVPYTAIPVKQNAYNSGNGLQIFELELSLWEDRTPNRKSAAGPVYFVDITRRGRPIALMVTAGSYSSVSREAREFTRALAEGIKMLPQVPPEGTPLSIRKPEDRDKPVLINLNDPFYEGPVPEIVAATRAGELESVRKELSRKVDPNTRDAFQRTALHWAAIRGRKEIADLLLARGAQVDPKDQDERTPLSFAAVDNRLEVARVLLAKGADANGADYRGWTHLHLAVYYGHLDMVRLLLDKGARVNAQTKDLETPIQSAFHEKPPELAKLLISRGASVTMADKYGGTPLHTVAHWGEVGSCQVLVASGADVNAKTTAGLTPLHEAAAGGRVEAARFLLQKGAKLEARDADGETPLQASYQGVVPKMQEFLIQSGADVKAKDNQGNTPLHKAARNQPPEVAKLLIAKGADPFAKNRAGQTPLDIATGGGKPQGMATYLRQVMAARKRGS